MTSETLPESWRLASLEELVDDDTPVVYGIIQAGPEVPGGVPYVRPTELVNDRIDLANLKRTSPSIAQRYERAALKAGDIVLAIVGTIGKLAIVPPELEGANITQSSARVRPPPGMPPEYLAAVLKSPQLRKQFDAMEFGVAVRRLNIAHVRALKIPVPPVREQRRIVAKLEALQARSRRAHEALDAVPPLLETLRKSVLAAAFRGDLTKGWRARHPDVEPASQLLKRIRIERRKKWEEAELRKLKAKGRAPTDDRWKGKYVEPAPVDATGLPELPDGWCWASVEHLASDAPRSIQSGPFGSHLLHSEFRDEGVLAIGIDNVCDGSFSMGAEHRISEAKFMELEKFAARGGDVLITVMATVGRCCAVPDDLETAIITKHVYRISPERQLVVPNYLMHSMRGAPALRDAMKADIRGQTRPGINGEVIRALPVPVAPLEEQRAVLGALDNWHAALTRLRLSHVAVTKLLGDLDKSTLAKAFRGELVPQDPNDEPAEDGNREGK